MITITPLVPEHWPDVRRIHLQGIATGVATFETATASGWNSWSSEHLPFARLAAVENGRVVGWAALSRVSDRCVYGGVAEVSIYIDEEARGRGIGSRLLGRLIEEAEAGGIWTLQAGIFPENTASLALHRKLGFRVVGCRERLGRLHGRWRDVLLLERRSERVGVD